MLKSFKVASVAGSHHRNVPARRAIACAIAAAFATTLSASAIAQDAPPSDDSAKLLDSVVVNAQFKQQNLQDTPLAITAITANRLDDMSIDNVAELGQIAPNVQMAQGGGIVGKTTAVYIRGVGGFDFSPAFEPGVGFYVDDVYHATVFGSSFDLLDIDRVEILRGPQGTLFGKNSIGGAVRIVSAAPNGDGTGRIEATIGAYDRRDLRASFDFGLTDNLAIRASALSRQREGHVDQIDFACANPTLAAGVPRVTSPGQDCKVGTLGGENASGARLQARWTPSDRFTLNFSVDRVTDNSEAAGSVLYYMDDSNAQMGLFNSLLGVPQYGRGYNSDFMPRNPYSSYASFKNDLLDFDLGSFNRLTAEGVAATMEWRLSDAFTLKSITAKRVTDGGFSFDFDGSPMAYNSQSNHLYAKQFSQEIQLLGTLMDGRLDVATGLFYLDLDTELTGIVNLGRLAQLGRAGLSFDQRNQSAVDNWAIFGHAMYKATS
jgi:iron complex outermembrane receptor protein